MAPKLAGMTEGVIVGLAANDRRRLGKTLKSSLAGVVETTMPSGWGRSGHKSADPGWRRWKFQGVEGPWTVTAKKGTPGAQVLHRNTKGVKFDGDKIISGELSKRKKIFDDVRSNKYIVEVKGTEEGGVPRADYREAPLPTIMEEGKEEDGDKVTIPGLEVM
jgi:hypothetical protein